jgi:putative inorganic carbon (HCO3(-)) transporter
MEENRPRPIEYTGARLVSGMVNALWQQLALATLPLQRWRDGSVAYRWVGSLRQWRKSSRLMPWVEWVGAVLLMVLFTLAPFVANELTGVLLGLGGLLWILLTLSEDEADRPQDVSQRSLFGLTTPIHTLVLLYWGICTVATALSPVRQAAFVGWQKLTLYLLLFALSARVLRSPRLRSWVLGAYLQVALWVSVYGIQQKRSGVAALATWVDPTSPLSKETRVYSYLGNPNLLGSYLLPAIALSVVAVFVWRHWGAKLLALMMVALNSACLYFTGSRGAWLGFVVMALVMVVLLWQWWSPQLSPTLRRWGLMVALGGSVAVILVALVAVDSLRDRALSVFLGSKDSSNNFRQNVWRSAIDMIRDRPILGIGPGNVAFNKVYPLYQRPRFSALSAYSVWLELAIEAGILGLLSFIWLLVVTFGMGWQRLHQLRDEHNLQGLWLVGAIASLAGLLGQGTFDTVLYRPEVSTLWWAMIALIASYYAVPRFGSKLLSSRDSSNNLLV